MSRGKHFPFLRLPGELRELIYLKALLPVENRCEVADGHKVYKYDLTLLRVNQQIHYEARKVFRDNNVFVSVSTPWGEAQHHVSHEGFVPIITSGHKARAFRHYHLGVKIETPGHKVDERDFSHFVFLIDDLKRFCDMWFYSDLTHPGLNPHLGLTLTLQDPYSLSFDPRPIPKSLQKRLLEPFGTVKSLSEVNVKGDYYRSIEKAMLEDMAVPYEQPEECIDEALRLKDEGDAAVQAKRNEEALDLYRKAFHAIHIVCEGRRRSIYAEAFFQTELHSDFEEARFWGERSITIMRDASGGEDGPMQDFIAAKEMGQIYHLTGKACKVLGRYADARQYFKVAMGYLPADRAQINADLNACHAPRSESF